MTPVPLLHCVREIPQVFKRKKKKKTVAMSLCLSSLLYMFEFNSIGAFSDFMHIFLRKRSLIFISGCICRAFCTAGGSAGPGAGAAAS